MSAEIFTAVSEELEYRAHWKIKKLTSLGSKSHRTSVFYPIPKVEVGFYFEILCEGNSVNQSSNKLSLIKVPCIDIPEGLKMELQVVVKYHTERQAIVVKDYSPKAAIVVKEMNSLGILNSDFLPKYDSYNFTYFLKDGSLELYLKFFEDPNSSLRNRLNSDMPNNLNNFAEDFCSIYNPCVLNDVQFKIGDTTLNAHKSILAAHSPVFLKMFTQDCLESKTNSVTIADTTDINFESFLKYLYSGKIEDKSLPNLMDLFVLADKYDVRTLKKECVETVATLLTAENIIEILVIAHGYHGKEMQARVKKFAADHIKALLLDEEWNGLVKSHPMIAYEVMAEVHKISESSK